MLKVLAAAYPSQRINKPTYQVYLAHLADIPAWLLEKAVQSHIETSDWFPRISELRQHAVRLANTSHFETLAPVHPLEPTQAQAWKLKEAAQALEDAFYHEGLLDPAEWERLAIQFERMDRPHRAEHTREKLRRLQLIA